MLALLTATFGPDLERFGLLRRSLLGFEVDLEHFAVVATEDMGDVADNLKKDPRLTLITTADVLPRDIERRRVAARVRRRDPRHWVRGEKIAGWYAQQLVKLAAVLWLPAQAYAVVDSDMICASRLTREDFIDASGMPRFFVNDELRPDDSQRWNRVSAEFLDLGVAANPGRQYIHMPQVLESSLVRRMADWIEGRYEQPWAVAMHEHNVFEFPTYGLFVENRTPEAVVLDHPLPVRNFSHFEEIFAMQEEVDRILRQRHKRLISVQSRLHIPVSAYEPLVQRFWQ